LRNVKIADDVAIGFHGILYFVELFIQAALRLVRERASRFTRDDGSRFQFHLLALEIAFKGIQEKAIMRNREPFEESEPQISEQQGRCIPVEDLLFFLSAYALVFEKKIQKW
jgi:hypothetical protein